MLIVYEFDLSVHSLFNLSVLYVAQLFILASNRISLALNVILCLIGVSWLRYAHVPFRLADAYPSFSTQ